MSECKHECVILKRICVFILGVLIGFAGGYKYGITEAKQKHHDKFMKKAEKPIPILSTKTAGIVSHPKCDLQSIKILM